MDIFKNWRKKNSKKIYRCERKFKNSKLIDWPYRKNEDLELKQNKNMENKEITPWNIMITDNYMPNGTEHTIGINLFFRLVAHMMKNNLIIDVEAGYLAFKEKENMRTEIKPNGEVYLHIHSLLKEVKELHIPPVDQETDIKSQVIDIITKALQEAKIKTAPEFERTRENMNEFGGCASAGKSVRVGLAQLMKQMSDPQLTGRLTAIMKKINLEDLTEARGYRAILISTQSQYLKGLNFDKNVSFDSIFFSPFTLTNTPARDSATLTVPAFNPVNFVNAPAGATHFRLISAISVISDFEFNSTSGIYEPIDPSLNEISNVAYSNYIDLGAPVALPTTITSTLPGSPVLTADVSVLNCIGIEFYQQVGVNYYLFNSGNALKVQDIF